jgi:hypothetical protein
MTARDSGLEPNRLAAARELLHGEPTRKERTWPALAAAAFAAFCALALAASMLVAPTFRNAEPPIQADLR